MVSHTQSTLAESISLGNRMSSSTHIRKKRALESTENTALVSSVPRPTGSSSQFVLQHLVDRLQADLDHERSLRSLDQKRAKHEKQRLEKQGQFAVEEAADAKAMLDQLQTQSDEM